MIDEAEAVSREHGWARFVSVQNEYSLLRRLPERGVLDACVRNDIGFLPYFPLASGMLTGKYRRNEAPPAGTRLANMPAERQEQAFAEKNFNRVEALEAWASRARSHAARARVLVAARAAGGRQRHRRRDEARAGHGERRRRGLVVDRRPTSPRSTTLLERAKA